MKGQLGFIGTGEIASAIVTGLSSQRARPPRIALSPRSPTVAGRLASLFGNVTVGTTNQQVVDVSNIVVVAVRPRDVRTVLTQLSFRPSQLVISLVSGLSCATLSDLVAPASRVVRAVPLPSAAMKLSPTTIFPNNIDVRRLFSKVGDVYEATTEEQFDAVCATTGTIATYFALLRKTALWLEGREVAADQANEYVSKLLLGAITTAVLGDTDLLKLADAHATKGGLNEFFLNQPATSNLVEHVPELLDTLLARLKASVI
ncbi:MAG: NAD(P)-binding domain-containing protein [Candidatus Eremiobacteraeota bacterium]|nr:NAD(P)-binding domain-containing protein [Candidatus Eremiobacteraeota bacterium]